MLSYVILDAITARRLSFRFFASCCALAIIVCAASQAFAERVSRAGLPDASREFLRDHCYDCHQGSASEAGLDLESLGVDLDDERSQKRWVRILDRVHAGEMPPPADAEPIDSTELEAFVRLTSDWLREDQLQRHATLGRVRARRLTRRELERSLHDLLGIDIPLADQLPDEAQSSEFTTVAENQAVSHFQLERHLAVVDVALDEAYRRAFSPADRYERRFEATEVVRENSRKRTREPEMLNGQAVVWSSGLIFYGRLPITTAPENGWYRFKVRISGLKLPKTGGVWTTARSGLCVSSAPLLAWHSAFEATEQPKVVEFEAWMPRRHMLEIRPGDTTLKRARFQGGQVGAGEGEPQDVPGIAIDWIEMQRIHHCADDEQVRRLLFGDVEVESDGRGRNFTLISHAPREDAAQLLRQFASRAFRRPVSADDLTGYESLVAQALDEGEDLATALRVGYRAILCSPRFLYLAEAPGQLDDYAIACRLSYMLTGGMPDERLMQLAEAGRLSEHEVIHAEVERLLSHRQGRQFVEDFAAEWLDLDQIDFTEPDRKLYPDFDAIVQNSMLDETHAYLQTMLNENQSVTRLIDSDYTFLNGRLARFYEIEDIEGDELRRCSLEPKHHRGGVLTQGAILKVTANGSNTSPVVRGVWVSERLLGEPIPPPPDNVPAIEPDIRGASTIREMLAKHRSQDSCASCHVKIDPPGFALENYDPAGQWRERYLQVVNGDRERGPKVDASYTLPDGREFQNERDFRALIVADPERLARNLAEKLLVFGSGGSMTFADRPVIDQIVAKAAEDDFGFRSILGAVVTSPAFLSK